MTRCFIWTFVLFVYLSPFTFDPEKSSANDGASNDTVISAKVVESLDKDHEVRVLIKLRDESDDPLISRFATAPDSSRFISNKAIKGLQSRFDTSLTRDGLQDEVWINHRLNNIPWITGAITRKALAKLQKNPNVAMIVEDEQMQAFLAQSGPLINSDDANGLGYTGEGVAVAVLDTGIDTDHPYLVDDLIHEVCFLSSGCPTGGTESESPGCAEDGHGHGTHVSGIITSSNATYRGIAPDTGIVAIKVLSDSGSGWSSDIAAGIDWVTSNKDDYGIRVINMSLGGGPYSEGNCEVSAPTFAAACDAAKSAGITIFAASGNSALESQMGSPACLSSVISVGAVYDANFGSKSWGICSDSTTYADKIVCFSNVSAVLDILAPGAKTTSTYKDGGTTTLSGTSMATPHAAAVAALMFQNDPTLTPDDIESILKCSGTQIFDSRIGMSFSRVEALAALSTPAEPVDGDGDGHYAPPCGSDCDDTNPNVNPERIEICDDGIDNDCDGLVDCDDPDCCCDEEVPTIYIGQTVNGVLSSNDCRSQARGSSYYSDRYSFFASTGQKVAIWLSSAYFDTYLYLIGPDGTVVAYDDDGGGYPNSRIPPNSGYYTLPSTGTYIIEVTSYYTNKTGSYTLSLVGPEDCTNGSDDDGDGLIDCNDPDCAGSPNCTSTTTTSSTTTTTTVSTTSTTTTITSTSTTTTTTSTTTTTIPCDCPPDSQNCISGRVTNRRTGDALAEKTVKLRRTSPRRPRISKTAVTDESGCYSFTNLDDGIYKVKTKECRRGGAAFIVISGGTKYENINFKCKQ